MNLISILTFLFSIIIVSNAVTVSVVPVKCISPSGSWTCYGGETCAKTKNACVPYSNNAKKCIQGNIFWFCSNGGCGTQPNTCNL